MQTHDLGKTRFWGLMPFPGKPARPVVETSVTQELEPPWRSGSGVAVRVTRGWSLVFGRWTGGLPPDASEAEVEQHMESVLSPASVGAHDPDDETMRSWGFEEGEALPPIGEW